MLAGDELRPADVAKIKSKAAQKYLLQYDLLTLKKDVLHHLYIHNDGEHHQLILPEIYYAKILPMIHDDQAHQGAGRTITIC